MQRNIPHHDLGISEVFFFASDLPGYLVSDLNLENKINKTVNHETHQIDRSGLST